MVALLFIQCKTMWIACMLTVLQGYTSFLAESPVLLHCCLVILVIFINGTSVHGLWLVAEHGQQTVVSAQEKFSDKEELLLGDSQEAVICFLLNHFLCLPFFFLSFIRLFYHVAEFGITSKNAALWVWLFGLVWFFLFCFFFGPCLSISSMLCWSWCLAVLLAASEAASNHEDPAVCVNFVKVSADWHFHTCNRGKLCSRQRFIYSF